MIVSSDLGNEYSPRVIVAPVSSRRTDRVHPFEVMVLAGEGGLHQTSKVLLNQIRTVDRRRLGRRIGALDEVRMHQVDAALRLSLGL